MISHEIDDILLLFICYNVMWSYIIENMTRKITKVFNVSITENTLSSKYLDFGPCFVHLIKIEQKRYTFSIVNKFGRAWTCSDLIPLHFAEWYHLRNTLIASCD